MIIAVCSQGPGLNSMVDQSFQRCAYFLLIYSDARRYNATLNPNIFTTGDAVAETAQFLSEKYVSVVLARNIEPKALATLDAAGIKVYVAIKDTVANNVEFFKQGKLEPALELSLR